MTKTFQIVDMSDRGFDVVATDLSFVDACNQAMALNVNVDGLHDFREIPANIETRAEYFIWQNRFGGEVDQGGWAYL